MNSLVIKRKGIPLLEICLIAFLYVLKNTYYIRSVAKLLSGLTLFENVLYVFVLFTILYRSYRTKNLFLTCCCVIALLLCYLHTGQADLLKGFIVILVLKDLPADNVFKMLGKTYIVGIILVFLLYMFGISDAGVLRRNGIALGFATTNIASRIIQLGLFLILVSSKKMKPIYKTIAICIIVAVFTYITTKSRLSALLIFTYPFVRSIIERGMRSRRKYLWRTVSAAIPFIFMLLTVVIAKMYSNSATVQSLNMTFSNRIYMNLVAIQKYGITVFGTAADIAKYSGIFDPISNKYINFLTIDSQYIYVLVYYGFLGVALVVGSLTLCIKKAWDHNNSSIATAMLLLSVYMLTETVGTIFGFPFLIYLSLRAENKEDNYAYNI